MASVITFGVIFAVFVVGYLLIQRRQRVDWAEAARRTGLDVGASGDDAAGLSGRRSGIDIQVTDSHRWVAFADSRTERVMAFELSFESVGPQFQLTGADQVVRLARAATAGTATANGERFEDVAIVDGPDLVAVGRFLDPQRRAALVPFFVRDPTAIVTNSSISWARRATADSTDNVVGAVDALVDLVLLLRAHRDSGSGSADQGSPE